MANKIQNISSHCQAQQMAQFSTNDTDDDDLMFFSYIDEATKEWLKSLNSMWQLWKKCDGVSTMLTDYFESAPNPYLSTIRILVNTSDFKKIKLNSSLAFTVIEEYAKWLEPRKCMYKHFLVTDLKLATFRLIITQKNMQFIKLVSATYEFIEHKEEFLSIIEKMIKENKYTEAAQYIVMLKLQSYFQDLESLLLPLILQNKLAIVEEFLSDCPQMQIALVKYLDNLIASDNNMHDQLTAVIKENNIPDIIMSTIQTKPMNKLIARYVKLYNLPPEVCPNLNKKRCEGALYFLIHKRYTDCSFSTAGWREMVQETVGNDKKLQLDMIRMLVNARDAKEGLYWAREFNIPEKQWPWAISYEAEQIKTERINEGASTSRGEMSDWEGSDDSVNYHELQLSRDSIKVVNDPTSFEEFLDNGLKDVDVVGIDSEWKPNFGTKQTELALIQVATKRNVFILDVTTMGNKSTELWTELVLTLFENKSILKLGFGIAHDMTVIHDSLPPLSNVKIHGPGYLDIVELWKKLVDDYKFVFPHKGDHHFTKKSLSKLVELCLGQKLNKCDQFSNWEQRPLRESQIIYAALDAYCLLEIYEVLERQCEHLDIPFLDICAEIQHIPYRSPKKNTKKTEIKTHTFWKEYIEKQQNFQKNRPSRKSEHVKRVDHRSAIQENRPQMLNLQVEAHNWRVVCDSMLGGLTGKLRLCGCDCVHIVFDQHENRSVKTAIQENRIFLTRRKKYLKFSQYLSPGNSYLLMTDTPDDQLREVLNHFGVLVTQRDIYSRCMACNSDEFAKVPKLLMDKLSERFGKLTRRHANYRVPLDSLQYPIRAMDFSEVSITNSNNNSCKQSEDRTWILSMNSINTDTCTTKYHTKIQIDKVPKSVLKATELFYVCERCGKVYWDGMNLERTFNLLRDVIVRV